jgi:hypothetical protein
MAMISNPKNIYMSLTRKSREEKQSQKKTQPLKFFFKYAERVGNPPFTYSLNHNFGQAQSQIPYSPLCHLVDGHGVSTSAFILHLSEKGLHEPNFHAIQDS